MKKLNKLTEEQKKQIPTHVQKWIAKGLSTEPADFETFERSVKECYKSAGLNTNVPVIKVSNPFVGAFASMIANNILKNKKFVGRAVGSTIDGAVRGAVGGAVSSAVSSAVNVAVIGAVNVAVYGAVRGAVYGAVGGAVRSAVSSAVNVAVNVAVIGAVNVAVYGAVVGAVRGAVSSAVNVAVDNAVEDAVRDAVNVAVSDLKNMSWHSWMGGSFWAGWQAYIDYYYSVCHLDLGEDINARAKAYMETQMAAGHWWPNSNFIMVCDRPKEIKLDDNGRLHNEENMAISWRDGIGLYFYHGQHVPGWIITNPEKITITHIQDEKNMEIQRCMIEKYGVSRYLMDISAKIIDMDCLNLIGSAPRALMRDDKGNQWLVASDGSTKRIYHIAVDSNVKTCKEAHESVCGFDESIITVEA